MAYSELLFDRNTIVWRSFRRLVRPRSIACVLLRTAGFQVDFFSRFQKTVLGIAVLPYRCVVLASVSAPFLTTSLNSIKASRSRRALRAS